MAGSKRTGGDGHQTASSSEASGIATGRRTLLAAAAGIGAATMLGERPAAAQSARSNRPSLILVGGLACTPDLWTAQAESLKDVADVVVTEENWRHPTMRGIAQAILRRAPPEFALAGLSMGGYIALEIMRIAPQRVTRLALLDTSARPDTDAARQARGVLMDLAHEEGMRAVLMRLMPNAVHPSRFEDKALVDRIVQMAWELGTDTFYRQTGAIMGRQDSRDLLREIKCPTLVAVGDSDKITPPELAREMASGIAGSKLVLFPECGHFSSMERPAAVTAALREWLTA
jgi:pimeloyl-ACP methyl ester carboxylesterase